MVGCFLSYQKKIVSWFRTLPAPRALTSLDNVQHSCIARGTPRFFHVPFLSGLQEAVKTKGGVITVLTVFFHLYKSILCGLMSTLLNIITTFVLSS